MRKFYSICLILVLAVKAMGQEDYNKTIFNIKGDLNKDGLADLVIVKANTNDKHHPYSLEILFAKNGGGYESVFSSLKTVMPKFSDGDERTELILEKLQIVKGVLIFTNQRIRGNMTHKFRYQNGNFELIGYINRNAGNEYIDNTEINLSTGLKTVWHEPYGEIKNTPKKVSLEKYKPLPRLQDFIPLGSSHLGRNGVQKEL
ncbi:hypothetical protein [Chryseobacterium sp. SIMBA_029]|uniref:hypothetical protein n=1 Tax=Chryseobacterium sp. SIMBA_029 TaxID=3085772 RepID=UPI00397A8FEB